MKMAEVLTLEHVKTFRSKKGREVIGLLEGHLGENDPGTTSLTFPDPDCPEEPFWWFLGGTPKKDSTHGEHTEVLMLGSLTFSGGYSIKVELDYEDSHQAQRLKVISAEGVAFFSECENVVPKWMQSSKGPGEMTAP